ncbi:MAG: methyltransferase domain-containing protein [Calditrichaeota bacterium]|nr:methyltransferase domain-containing protein [Calditrichota bacterium]
MQKRVSSDRDKPPQPRPRNGDRRRAALGPVPNLEEHVRSDWWRGIFNSLYLKTDADVVADDAITRTEVDLFSDLLRLAPEQPLLDLCCGQGRHCLELARRGLRNVEGLDRSHYLIQRAKATARSEGLQVRFREGDARKLPYPADAFDVITILGNSFGYFESVADDLRVLKEILRTLRPWGRLLVDVTDGDFVRAHYQPRSWEWIDRKHFVCRERSLSAGGDRLITREVITHVDRGVLVDQFYAERLYNRESLADLMKTAGIGDFTLHAEFSPNSARNQDLGMMAQRLVATSVCRKDWTPRRKKARSDVRNVVVLLGDPSKPDPLKPLTVWDDDDFYTIDQMKAALKEIPGYDFAYLNSHDSLASDLKRLAGRFDYVLNLCDEGFGNDPRRELHIPALLEQLDIPYTGAGPQCLAYCYDKSLVRGIAKEMEIPVPEAIFVKPGDIRLELPVAFPMIVKPNYGDSSFGITQRSIAYNHEDLANAILDIRGQFGYDKPLLVEEFLTGRDISVGIIGNPPESYLVLPVIEEDYSVLPEGLPHICGYEAKWLPESPYWQIRSVPADLPEETRQMIVAWCLRLFTRLECRDYARFDWRLDAAGRPKLLEVNPNPGWCWDGHLAKMFRLGGGTYSRMLQELLQSAERRIGLRPMDEKRDDTAAAIGMNGNGAQSILVAATA